jgi:hypothetical protein
MVQKPKKKGGLGVINLRLQNDALLLKQLHKFYSKKDIPWVSLIWSGYYTSRVPHASIEVGSFWWKDLLSLNVLYRGIAKCTIGDGSTIAFWGDLWSTDILSEKFPRFFSFAINPDISVKEIIMAQDLDSIFHLPISEQASQELGDLQDLLLSSAYFRTSLPRLFSFAINAPLMMPQMTVGALCGETSFTHQVVITI